MPFKIALIHPSRNRPAQAFAALSMWHMRASGDPTIEIKHYLSVDEDDPELSTYSMMFSSMGGRVNPPGGSVVAATNSAAARAYEDGADILVYLSDDFECPERWDVSVVARCFLHAPCVLKVNDGLQPVHVRVLTIPIMNRKAYESLGYFFHPAYLSMFCDQHLYEVAALRGWIRDFPDLLFRHKHHSLGLSPNDETYRASERNWSQGETVYNTHKSHGFLPPLGS
jgi:hypothetical protein